MKPVTGFFSLSVFEMSPLKMCPKKSPLLKGPEMAAWHPPVQPKIGIRWIFFGAQLPENIFEMGLQYKIPVGKLTKRG